ncbi:MAG: NADH-quinone oxidoreductase subunit N, partial [Bdellovibrionales bacterium]|nr:NADH-quinone oxidoreductase subunit N [Bdellovibrionales bacterium]
VTSSFGSDSDAGVASLMFYLMSYCIMTLGTLALVILFERNEKTTLLTTDLKGLGTKQPLLALSLSVLLFSLAGLPPSIGFFSKFYIFSAAIEQGFYWMTFVGVIGSVISVYYYLRPVVCMYMLEGEGMEIRKEVFFSKAVVYISALGVCILGLFSSQIFYYVQSSVANSL